MSRELVNRICAALPGAECSDPWGGGHDAWKVGGKMFACIGARGTGVSLKTSDVDTARELIDQGGAERAPYFHRSWVHIPWGWIERGLLRERIHTSYDIIRGKLPKKVQKGLPARETDA